MDEQIALASEGYSEVILQALRKDRAWPVA